MQEKRETMLQATNAQLQNTLSQVRSYKTELEAKVNRDQAGSGHDVEAMEEEPVALVNMDQVVQGQDGDAHVAAIVVVITEVTNLPVKTGPITEHPSATDQGAE